MLPASARPAIDRLDEKARTGNPELQSFPVMERVSDRRGWWIVIVIAVGSTWISPLQRELFVGDETKYGRVVYEMTQSDQRLVPMLEGEPYAHKPPLHFWLLAALAGMFGIVSIWTFVLPSLLFFIVLVWLTGVTARRVLGRGSEIEAAAIFSTFWLAWIVAQTARMDMMFVAAITVGALALFEFFENRRKTILLAGLAFGLAILIKGPMAGVIAIALYLTEWSLRRRAGDEATGWVGPVVSLIAMLAVPLVWLVPAIASGGAVYGRELLVEQSVGRAFEAWTHAEPPWFYVVRFPLTFFPWFVLVALGGWHTLRHTDGAERRRIRFLLSWFFAVFVPFSIVSGKLDVYMLPAMVPGAVLAAHYVGLVAAKRERLRTGSMTVVAGIGILFLGLAVAARILPRQEPELALLDRGPVLALVWSTVIVSAAGLVIQWRTRDPGRRTRVLALVALTPLVMLVVLLIPTLNEISSTVPLIRSLERTGMEPSRIGLHWTPHLWSRTMGAGFQAVRYDEVGELRSDPPAIIAVRRDHAEDLGALLERYRRVDQLRMIGKDFDVYERDE